TIIEKSGDEPIHKRMHVGVLVVEHVEPLDENSTAMEGITNLVAEFKSVHELYPHQLAQLSRERARNKLREASRDLQIELENQSQVLHEQGMREDAKVATDIASALSELRENGVYAVDVHGGNVGYSRKDKVFRLFDIGTSSSPRANVPTVPVEK